MLRHRFSFGMLVATFVLASACGASTSSNPTDTGSGASSASSCTDLASSARQQLDEAIRANQKCSADADCVQIAFAADCFDSCSTAVSNQGTAAVDAARARVNQAQCASFKSQGCRFDIPPCVPPQPPACVEGLCR